MPPLIVIPPEKIAQARHLYEGTSVEVADIARFLGIGTTTFMKRVKLWEWMPRNRRLADLDAAAKADVPVEQIRVPAARFARDHPLPQGERVKSMPMHSLIATFTERGDLAHLAHFLWAAGASGLLVHAVRELAAAARRFDDFVRELARFNERQRSV